MKKLFIIMTLVCVNYAFAQTQTNTTEETAQTRIGPNTNAPTIEPLTPNTTDLVVNIKIINPNLTNNIEPNPLPPSKTIIAEVEESEQPSLLKELEDIRAELKTLREDKQELLARVKQLQSEKADIKEDFDVATKQIQEFIAERSELRSSVKELRDTINKGPGSLFKGWVYSQELDWVYVSPTIVPYSYSQKNGWMMYQYGSNPRRVFYFETESWERLDTPMITESNQER